MTDKHARRVPKCLNLERTNILFISYRYHRLDLLISTMSQNECIHSSVSGGVLFRTVPGDFAERHFAERHFAERTFCRRTLCRTNTLSNGQYDERTFRRKDVLPKRQLAENREIWRENRKWRGNGVIFSIYGCRQAIFTSS